ncbi:MAG TPA: sigma-54 dependent transcriptional regulator [Marinagarivorans sp.]
MRNRILIIEDDIDQLALLYQFFSEKGWQVAQADTIARAKTLIDQSPQAPQVILADLGLLDGNVLDYLQDWQKHLGEPEWIFALDAQRSSLDTRLSALAYEVINKPFELERLDICVNRALRAVTIRRRLRHYSKVRAEKYSMDAYIGSSSEVKQLKKLLKQLCGVPLSSLTLCGETGTGKGLVARILHHNGLHREGPLVELNCAALPKDLLESQLFGHEAGAFTGAKGRLRGLFEQADGGTLFLDEIADLDFDLQAKLLKVIEDGKVRRLGGEGEISVNVQIIAATGIDLAEAVTKGRFREDLYHRLSVFSVALVPLRKRKTDLVELIPQIIAEFNIKANKRVDTISDEAWEYLLSYDWPGNIRELRNALERCVLLSSDDQLPTQWLRLHNDAPVKSAERVPPQGGGIRVPETKAMEISPQEGEGVEGVFVPLDGSMTMDEMEQKVILAALKKYRGNVTRAARLLGATRETLRYRIQKYGLKP